MTIEERAQSLPLSLRGRLVRPGDNDFDTARHIWNGMIDRRPALIVRAADAADVVADGQFRARRRTCSLAIRGGGHSAAGTSVSDGGADARPFRNERDPGGSGASHRTAQSLD